MTGTFKHRMEIQYKINERFQTQDVIDFGIECTWKMYTTQHVMKL